MKTSELINTWFEKWVEGDVAGLPISENFRHTSPFGTISGKKDYIGLVEANRDKFLGYHFIKHDEMYEGNRACVRYTAIQEDFKLDVSEWYYVKDGSITEIISYYHIGEIREERKLGVNG